MNIKDIMRKIIDDSDNESKEPIRSFPCKPEWSKKFKEAEELARQLIKAESKMKALRHSVWSDIELETEICGHMRWNEESEEIEVLDDINSIEEKSKRKPRKSPFYRNSDNTNEQED